MTALEASRSQDKVAILKRVPVFAACSEEQLHFIADRTRLMEYKKGEYIFREGDKAEAFYIVSSGRLRIFSQTDGQEKTLATLHNSDFFGEMALLVGEVRSATAQALNDTLVLQLTADNAADMRSALRARRGNYRFHWLPGLEIEVIPSQIFGEDGSVIEVIG